MVFVKVGELSELAPGKMKKVTVGDKEFLIINVDGKYYAIGARCTHAAATFHRAPWRVML
jgi:nitrite reductase/ring-hydroxylating ferredoxin subunit